MTITLDLPETLEQELAAEAAQLGLSVASYALHVLTTRAVLNDQPQTGAELVEYWQRSGLIGVRSDISDSQTHARHIRAQAEQRQKHQP